MHSGFKPLAKMPPEPPFYSTPASPRIDRFYSGCFSNAVIPRFCHLADDAISRACDLSISIINIAVVVEPMRHLASLRKLPTASNTVYAIGNEVSPRIWLKTDRLNSAKTTANFV